MKPKTFEEALDAELALMRGIMIARQTKYGPENIKQGGIHGLIVRMQDKLERIKQDHRKCHVFKCINQRSLPDEEMDDAWIDLANYAGPIALMLVHGTWGLPMEPDIPLTSIPRRRSLAEPPPEKPFEYDQVADYGHYPNRESNFPNPNRGEETEYGDNTSQY